MAYWPETGGASCTISTTAWPFSKTLGSGQMHAEGGGCSLVVLTHCVNGIAKQVASFVGGVCVGG